MAYDQTRDSSLGMLDVSHLFEPSITYLALRKETYLRQYLTAFIEMYAPHLDCALANNALDITRISNDVLLLPTHGRSCSMAAKRFC